MPKFFNIIRNAIDYPLRQHIHWHRPGLIIKNEPKDRLFPGIRDNDQPLAQLTAKRLIDTYHLGDFSQNSTWHNYLTNLYYLEMFERAMQLSNPILPDTICAVDIGASDWFYVQALYHGIKWWRNPQGRKVSLKGFEKDPYRVYADLYSRSDHAIANIRKLEGIEYFPESFLRLPTGYNFVCMFFPFVFIKDHLDWGLPNRHFYPQALLKDAWDSLKPGGFLMIVNQGEAEHKSQKKMMEIEKIPVTAIFENTSLLCQYSHRHFVITATK